jgi:hypothetical protein
MGIHLDPAGRFAIRATKRSVELWTVQPITFDYRPDWQSRPNGAVALLHHGLSGLEPQPGDVLTSVWAGGDEKQRFDVENRLFTNVLPKATEAPRGPNVFAHLPKRVRFERSFHPVPPPDGFNTGSCLYYRYALSDQSGPWENWQMPQDDEPLASWRNVQTSGLSTGNGWTTWASMRQPHAQIMIRSGDEPYQGDFALRLSIRSPKPLQLVSSMESIVDGVIASFQREDNHAQAEAVARLIWPHISKHGLTHDLVAAQCAAPRLFAPAPFQLNPSQTNCSLHPADHQLVAGYIELTVLPNLESSVLSGLLHQVERTLGCSCTLG